MTRLIFFAILAIGACRLFTGKWPWQLLQGQSPQAKALQRARALLDGARNLLHSRIAGLQPQHPPTRHDPVHHRGEAAHQREPQARRRSCHEVTPLVGFMGTATTNR